MCGRKPFKIFNKFLSEDPLFLYNVHDLVLKDMFNAWIKLKKGNPKVTILDFGQAQSGTEEKFKRIFRDQDYTTFE